MANDIVLNPASGGATLATDEQTSGAHVQKIKQGFGPDASDITLVSKTDPLPVDVQAITAATRSHATTASLAAGGSTDLDSAQISSGTTGKLMAVWACASVPMKVELKTVLNAVESAVLAVGFAQAGDTLQLVVPTKEAITQAESATAGLDGFRASVTNLDTSQAADAYCTFFWDEA